MYVYELGLKPEPDPPVLLYVSEEFFLSHLWGYENILCTPHTWRWEHKHPTHPTHELLWKAQKEVNARLFGDGDGGWYFSCQCDRETGSWTLGAALDAEGNDTETEAMQLGTSEPVR